MKTNVYKIKLFCKKAADLDNFRRCNIYKEPQQLKKKKKKQAKFRSPLTGLMEIWNLLCDSLNRRKFAEILEIYYKMVAVQLLEKELLTF